MPSIYSRPLVELPSADVLLVSWAYMVATGIMPPLEQVKVSLTGILEKQCLVSSLKRWKEGGFACPVTGQAGLENSTVTKSKLWENWASLKSAGSLFFFSIFYF